MVPYYLEDCRIPMLRDELTIDLMNELYDNDSFFRMLDPSFWDLYREMVEDGIDKREAFETVFRITR